MTDTRSPIDLVLVPREPTEAMIEAGMVHMPNQFRHILSRTFKAMLAAAPAAPPAAEEVERAASIVPKGGVPEIPDGGMKCVLALVKNKNSKEYVTPAYYLNGHPLEYEDCVCDSDDDHTNEGCPTPGWFYNESNFEYENCFYAIEGEVIGWAALLSVDTFRAALSSRPVAKTEEDIRRETIEMCAKVADAADSDNIKSDMGDAWNAGVNDAASIIADRIRALPPSVDTEPSEKD